MFSKFKTATLSAMIGLGALAAMPAAAHADGVYLNFGNKGDPRFGIYQGDDDQGGYQERNWRRDARRDWRRTCTPDRALDKADRMGLHRTRVVDMDRYTIKVAGRQDGERRVVVFGRDRSCPIVYR